MNITDLIVDFVLQGHSAELPGIGSFCCVENEAHLDPDTHTFYPASHSLSFSMQQSGDTSVIDLISEKECVNAQVAQMMWNNYLAALSDRLKRNGSHVFKGLGTLNFDGVNYSFKLDDNLVIGPADASVNQPIDNVAEFASPDNQPDPFAVFEQIPAPEPEPEPAPAPEPEPEPAPVPEPEPEPIPEPEPEPEPEPIPEPAPIPAPTPEPDPVPAPEPVPAPDPEQSSHLTTADEIEKQLQDVMNDSDNDDDKKKHHWWIWLIVAILLLAAGGAAYYLFVLKPNKAVTPNPNPQPTASSHARTDGFDFANTPTLLTFNTDLIDFDDAEVDANACTICSTLRDYIAQYLASRQYPHALDPFMVRVKDYSSNRLYELLDTNVFSFVRFVRFDDYQHNAFYNALKRGKASHARVTIQTELMNLDFLNNLLDALVVELGLQPWAPAAPAAAPAVTKNNAAAPDPAPVQASFSKKSKQGFDVVAGFFTNKSTAIKLANRLKSLGCDAYIIDRNSLYYVSMGSASTRTAAEALYKHIKSWYKDDIAIKEL